MSIDSNVMETCHKSRIKNVQGTLKDPEGSYGEWAFWCCQLNGGWTAAPCEHTPEDQMIEWTPPWLRK